MVRFGLSWGALAAGGNELVRLTLAVSPPPRASDGASPAAAADAPHLAPQLPRGMGPAQGGVNSGQLFVVGAPPAAAAAASSASARERAPQGGSGSPGGSHGDLAPAAPAPAPWHAPILSAASALLPPSQPPSLPLAGARPP